MSAQNTSRRVLYMAGPGDVINTYRCWCSGIDDPSQIAVTYSSQFFEFCRANNFRGTIISYHQRRESFADEQFSIEHHPVLFSQRGGLLFHIGWYAFNATVAMKAILQRCDVLVLMTGTHLLPYWLARLAGCKVILTEQCVLWPKLIGRKGFWKWIHYLDRSFFRRGASAILSLSNDISDQINELTSGRHGPIFSFFPTYRSTTFDSFRPNFDRSSGFRVLFIGRIEENKGILDLLEIATRIRTVGRDDIKIEIAGDGSAMAAAQRYIREHRLTSIVTMHGHLARGPLAELLKRCHTVILPTRSDMLEGFNKGIAESVLALRPWISSKVCPAIEYVPGSGAEVPPDDPNAYLNAITSFVDNPHSYASAVSKCEEYRAMFFEKTSSWMTALGIAFDALFASRGQASASD